MLRRSSLGLTVKTVEAFLLLYVCAMFVLGCNGAAPTLHGIAIKNETVATATKVAHVADIAAATVVKGITAGVASGIMPPDTARVYAIKIGPRVQSSLDGLRKLLIIAEQSPHETTTEKLMEASALLQEAISIAQSFLLDPKAWIAANP